MIHFSCTNCGLKLRIKPAFAGRSSKCPTCKKPLVVPPDKTVAFVPTGQIDGTPSSIHQAGVLGGVTLGKVGQRSIQELLARQTKKGERYVIEKEIARGGMGVVLLAADCDLHREVAIKFMLGDEDSKHTLRFIEEAQITGQLEHPNIVPIHELGLDAKKRLFFSMKMVRGRSLKEVVDLLRENPRDADKDYYLGKLLTIFVSVCNGMAYAHSRGVVHRDLKPANIMTGDFGEVYVMDWGLAKVLKAAPMATLVSGTPASAQAAIPVSPSQSSSAKPSSKVSTSREPEADLTQEGSVIGTPVYMPPEQAMGEIDAIDERSDIYSLGAILYEMLTLQPPIDKEGGHISVLMRVVEGQITSPEQRTPARAGRIPRELSAIAMKALAKEKNARYQTVEELRQDIERFQEGRSVSAKQDTAREMVWKLVKRNKAVSFISTVAFFLVVFIWGRMSWANYEARLETDKAYKSLKRQTEDAVPALVRASRLAINERQFEDALKQADLALAYAPDNADAMLQKGQVLIVQQEFAKAQSQLEEYLKHRPQDKDAGELLGLCRNAKPDNMSTLLAIARVFYRQQTYSLVDGLLSKYGKTSVEARNQILQMYREVIEKTWKGNGAGLQIDPTGMHLSLANSSDLADLSPLKGIPLTSLNLYDCRKVKDLTPLKGMLLTSLNLAGYGGSVSDLMPLKGMPLTILYLCNCGQVSDLTPLKGMPLTLLHMRGTGVSDLTPLHGMNVTEIWLTPKTITRGMDVLRHMKSLKTISFDGITKFSPTEFWKKYDAGEFK